MSNDWNCINLELVTFSENFNDKRKVDFKMMKNERTLEPKKKSKTCSSFICLLTAVFISGEI